MILTLALKYWKQLAIAFLIVFVFSFGYYKGYSNQKEKFDAFKLQIEANAKVQKDKNELLVKKQEQITDNVTKEYADAINKLNAYYANRMHNNSSSSTMPQIPSSSNTTNGETESNLSSTLRDCALDVTQLLYLQKWIKDNQLIQGE